MRCLAKNLAPTLFKLDRKLTSCKKYKITMRGFGENPLANGQMIKQTNGKTDKTDGGVYFIGTSLHGPKNELILETSRNNIKRSC